MPRGSVSSFDASHLWNVVLFLEKEDDSRRNDGKSSLAQPYRFSPTDVGLFIASLLFSSWSLLHFFACKIAAG